MIDERLWKIIQRRLGYSDEELETFRAEARNELVLSKAKQLFETRLTAKVVDSHGCNSKHKTGDQFFFDGYGNLLKEQNPDKICIFALSALSTLIFTAQELVYAGLDPNEMCFNHVDCIDVGLKCGGWGKVVMELTAE